ncbi:uncharacterized protein EV154DRAFT_478728 [Mucor mucedo]|uniref:uncharacterized protein n=1 Tax=Mucor mucedo TaxID=29922 RepID=UPI00221FB487|nr:uncharacterized protein EV154DRAFT_478728 [Mucor mucedo]KAI7894217.1 hypothetical protein EV154DRAFT_478728 [Mucor mucedo]
MFLTNLIAILIIRVFSINSLGVFPIMNTSYRIILKLLQNYGIQALIRRRALCTGGKDAKDRVLPLCSAKSEGTVIINRASIWLDISFFNSFVNASDCRYNWESVKWFGTFNTKIYYKTFL